MEEFPNYMAFNPENHQLCHSTTLQCGRKNYPLCRRWGRWLGCDLAAGHRLVPRTMQRLFLLPSWRRRPSSAPPLSNSRSGFHGQIRSNSLLSPSQEKKNLRAIYISHRSCSTFFHPFAMARILLAFAGDAASAAMATATGLGRPWFMALCMVVVCSLTVSFAVFLCGHSSGVHDGDLLRKKKPMKPPPPSSKKKKVSTSMSGTVVDTTGMYTAAYGVAVVGGHGGHGGGGGGGCCGGGGGGGCGGGGGGGGC